MFQIPASRSEGKFSARWYSLYTEMHNFQDTDVKLKFVEVGATTRRLFDTGAVYRGSLM